MSLHPTTLLEKAPAQIIPILSPDQALIPISNRNKNCVQISFLLFSPFNILCRRLRDRSIYQGKEKLHENHAKLNFTSLELGHIAHFA